MSIRTRMASAVAVIALAATPVLDGSFLVKGLVQKPVKQAPLTLSTPPALPVVIDEHAAGVTPQFRCPMVVIEADPKIDPKLVKPPTGQVQFAIQVGRPPCTAR